MADEKTFLSSTPVDLDDPSAMTPAGYLAITLSESQRGQLEPWLKNHLEQIETALADTHSRFQEERNQFEGFMPGGDYPYPGAFRINVPLTKKKCREIANRLKQAYLDSDPIWALSSASLPNDLTAQVEKSLDHQVDHELENVDDLSQAIFESVLHGAGVIEPSWLYFEDTVRDVFVGNGFDGLNPETLLDLARFEQEFPNWKNDTLARALHAKLASGHDVREEISYRTVTANRPQDTHIPIADVRAYPHLNSWVDLQRSPVYGYVKTYTRLELEDLAADGTIDESVLGKVFGTDSTDPSPREAMEGYEVFRGTIRYTLAEDDDPARYKIWYERDSGVILRMRAFPWWLNAPDLIFFHTRQEEPGLFKRGIAWDLRDTHTAANVAFSLYLNGADQANSMRWKAKSGSLAEAHIINRRWSPHLPMPWRTDPGEVESLATPTAHLGPLVQGFELLRRQSDEETQTSSLQSGRESPTDPNAPGNKTAILLQQTEPNTKEYLRSLEPGFRQLGKWLLWRFYQAKRLGWIEEIPGFPNVPDELLPELAKALNPRAVLFEFDRNTRLQADNMVLGWVSKLAPQAVPQVLRKAISHVSSDWSKEVNSLPLEAPSAPQMPGPSAAASSGTPASGGDRIRGLVPNNGAPTDPMSALAGLVR